MRSARQLDALPPDVHVLNGGTLFLFQPVTARGAEWIEAHVVGPVTWWGRALVVEHRYARPVAGGMLEDGLVLECGRTS